MDEELEDRRRRGLYRQRRPVATAQGATITIRGQRLLNFASNDYLGLAADPRLARSAARAARRYGTGAGASPLVSGHLPPLRRLELALCRWQHTDAALVFSSGYAANLAVMSTAASRADVVFSDELNHASLIDGCRLSRATVHVYRHADMQQLEDLLRQHSGRRRLILTDTVFSMDGDFAPLADLYELATRHDALLIVDEAHATGVLGATGRGLVEAIPPPAGFDPQRLLKIGTLSKALGSQGGFVCGTQRQIDWLINHARPYIFSTALAPPLAAAAHRAVRIAQEERERATRLLGMAHDLATTLMERGWNTHGSHSHILPLIVGDAERAVAMSEQLREKGILAPAIRPPSVPEGTSRLRLSLTAGHTEVDVSHLLNSLLLVR